MSVEKRYMTLLDRLEQMDRELHCLKSKQIIMNTNIEEVLAYARLVASDLKRVRPGTFLETRAYQSSKELVELIEKTL